MVILCCSAVAASREMYPILPCTAGGATYHEGRWWGWCSCGRLCDAIKTGGVAYRSCGTMSRLVHVGARPGAPAAETLCPKHESTPALAVRTDCGAPTSKVHDVGRSGPGLPPRLDETNNGPIGLRDDILQRTG